MAQQFDLFVSQEMAPGKASVPSAMQHQPSPGLNEDDMVRHLQATGRYRILKKLEPRPVMAAARPGFPLKGVILDTETTGLNHRKDEIIEIGTIAFTFDEAGNIGDVIGVYGGLQQPSISIPPEITRLTGITDDMVVGQTIDVHQLRAIVEPADLVIAHNAGFDRPFCEVFSPIFAGKAWACSISEVDWASRGVEGTKLGYLISQAGYFHEGHRAVDDCFALLEVLAQSGGEPGRTPFAELYAASQRSRVRIFAANSSAAAAAMETMERALDPVLGLQFFRAPARANADWPSFVDLFSGLRSCSAWPADLERVRLWYEPHLERLHEDAAPRRADLLQLEQIATGYPSRERFLTDLTLDPPDATSDEAGPPHLDEDYLILSTIHSAKGQEWAKVFVLNGVDGCIPSDLAVGERDELEEERRLLYVAMTRAKDSLHLIAPQRFFVHGQASRGDRHVYASRTRFIPDHILDCFARTSWPPPSQAAHGRAPQPDIRVDLKAKMRGMWR